MIIRPATPQDVPALVALLQASLGETMLKKTTAIWAYKHEANPFGRSLVLVAEAQGQLLGVRAFMKWRWQKGTTEVQAYRAVDTATHPAHQGQGLFKQLTLQAVDAVQTASECFIFNTPNAQSRPGYLKMGWQVLGKVHLALVPTLLSTWTLLHRKAEEVKESAREEVLDRLCRWHNEQMAAKQVFFTPKTPGYLSWRYADNPLQAYHTWVTPHYYVACYVKQHRYFKELRVAEVLGAESPKSQQQLQRDLIALALRHRCWVLTLADKHLFSFQLYGTFGPQVTCRDLTASQEVVGHPKKLAAWQYSLGDLELF